MSGFLQDCRTVARGLRRARGHTAIVVVTLALGTGASSAMFSVLRASLLRSPPFPDADRVVILSLTRREQGQEPVSTNLPTTHYELVREQATSFLGVAAFTSPSFSVTGYDQSERVPGEVVSADYFRVLGMTARAGRTFAGEEDSVSGAYPVVVISHALWERRFGSDPSVIGKQLRVNQRALTVVGVMPPRFSGVSGRAELWITRAMAPMVAFPYRAYSVVARLRDDVTIERARSEMRLLAARMQSAFPDSQARVVERGADVTALSEARIDVANRNPVLILFAAVSVLMLIACANTATLVLVRAASRSREVAVRLAVGASRWRLVRLLLTESIMLSVAGGIAGLLVAFVTIRAIVPMMPPRPSRAGAFGSVGDFAVPSLDPAVVGFAWLMIFATALLFGLAPAIRSASTQPADALRRGGRGATRHGWRAFGIDVYGALTALEIALAVVLLVGSGLVLRSLWHLESLPLGFDARDVTSFQISAPVTWYPPDQAPAVIERLVDAVERIPGVESAAATYYTPFDPGARHEVGTSYPGRDPGAGLVVGHHHVTPAYFAALGIPVLRGRPFSANDRLGRAPVAIVSAAAAERLWSGADPIGRTFSFRSGEDAAADPAVEVIGVVADVRYRPTEWKIEPDLYTPYYQFASLAYALFVVRSRVPIDALAPSLRQAVASVDRDLPVSDLTSLDERGGRALARRRLNAVLLAAFATLALVIATVGVYGMMAHMSLQRTREFGIRLALGARDHDVLGLVLGRAARLVLTGIALGTGGAIAASRVLASQLYGVSPTDLATYVAIATVLGAAALVASYAPARRATRAQPVTVLRDE